MRYSRVVLKHTPHAQTYPSHMALILTRNILTHLLPKNVLLQPKNDVFKLKAENAMDVGENYKVNYKGNNVGQSSSRAS